MTVIRLTQSDLLWTLRALELALAEARKRRNEGLQRTLEKLRLRYERAAAPETR